jgi:serine/threonine protein kinase/pimeloyl-ACP methyl ester carboxylesterase
MAVCPSDDALLALAERRLADEEAARLHLHLDECPRCRALLGALAKEGGADPTATTVAGGALRASWSPPPAFDGFDVIDRLGRGGMGEVYRARERALDRDVALKFIAAGNTDLRAFERFMVEARAIGRLQHPNVVSIFRIGEVLGRPYIAYEFVSGQSLDRVHKPVPWTTALQIGIGIARGLAAAHRCVLHRDIKPANIMLGAGGEVKLLDFGLAKLIDRHREVDEPRARAEPSAGGADPVADTSPTADTPGTPRTSPTLDDGASGRLAAPSAPNPSSGQRLTEEHIVLGTPLYLAPELWNGGPATARSDIYALGLVLYELCAGRHPYAGLDTPRLVWNLTTQELPPLSTCCPEVPRAFADAIDRCVRRIPEERFRSAEDLRAALEEVDALCRAFRITPSTSSVPPAPAAARVSRSFARIGPRVEGLVVRFYYRLFARAPALRALFPTDLRDQRLKLAAALRVFVDHLHAPERLDPMLEELGRKHAGYGVTAEHFDAFGEALLMALSDVEGDAWDPEVEQAWAAVYVQAAAAMRRGLSDAPPTIPVEEPTPLDIGSGATTGSGRIRYATNGDLSLAYQIVGDGAVDLVLVQGWVTHLDATWEHAAPAGFLHELAASARLIFFDQRGTGLSDRDGAGASPEQRMEDLRAVMDAAKSERAVLLGVGAGGAPCVHFAAAHPERTLGLIAYGSAARVAAGPDSPFGVTAADIERAEREIRNGWGRPLFIDERAPSRARDAAFRRWWAGYLRLGATPAGAIRMLKTSARINVRELLPGLRVRSLVLHRAGDRLFSAAAGRDLAERIPGARYVELPGDDHLPYVGNTTALLAEIRRFVFDIDTGVA